MSLETTIATYGDAPVRSLKDILGDVPEKTSPGRSLSEILADVPKGAPSRRYDDPSWYEYPFEFAKAVPRGAAGSLVGFGTGTVGLAGEAARLVGVDNDLAEWAMGVQQSAQEGIESVLPVGEGFEDSWTRAVGEGLGSVAVSAPAAVGGGALAARGLLPGAMKLLGPAGAIKAGQAGGLVAFGGATGYANTYQNARSLGATPEDARFYARVSALVSGGTEPAGALLPALRILKRANAATKGGIEQVASRVTARSAGKELATGAAREAFQEFVQEAPDEWARQAYIKDRTLWDGLKSMGESGAVGGIVGVLVPGASLLVERASGGGGGQGPAERIPPPKPQWIELESPAITREEQPVVPPPPPPLTREGPPPVIDEAPPDLAPGEVIQTDYGKMVEEREAGPLEARARAVLDRNRRAEHRLREAEEFEGRDSDAFRDADREYTEYGGSTLSAELKRQLDAGQIDEKLLEHLERQAKAYDDAQQAPAEEVAPPEEGLTDADIAGIREVLDSVPPEEQVEEEPPAPLPPPPAQPAPKPTPPPTIAPGTKVRRKGIGKWRRKVDEIYQSRKEIIDPGVQRTTPSRLQDQDTAFTGAEDPYRSSYTFLDDRADGKGNSYQLYRDMRNALPDNLRHRVKLVKPGPGVKADGEDIHGDIGFDAMVQSIIDSGSETRRNKRQVRIERTVEAMRRNPQAFSPEEQFSIRQYLQLANLEVPEAVEVVNSSEMEVGDVLELGSEDLVVAEKMKDGSLRLENDVDLEVPPNTDVVIDAGTLKPGAGFDRLVEAPEGDVRLEQGELPEGAADFPFGANVPPPAGPPTDMFGNPQGFLTGQAQLFGQQEPQYKPPETRPAEQTMDAAERKIRKQFKEEGTKKFEFEEKKPEEPSPEKSDFQKKKDEFEELIRKADENTDREIAKAKKIWGDRVAQLYKRDEPGGAFSAATVMPSTKNPGKWQLTNFNEEGPFSDSLHDSYEEAIKDATLSGYVVSETDRITPRTKTETWQYGLDVLDHLQKFNALMGKGKVDEAAKVGQGIPLKPGRKAMWIAPGGKPTLVTIKSIDDTGINVDIASSGKLGKAASADVRQLTREERAALDRGDPIGAIEKMAKTAEPPPAPPPKVEPPPKKKPAKPKPPKKGSAAQAREDLDQSFKDLSAFLSGGEQPSFPGGAVKLTELTINLVKNAVRAGTRTFSDFVAQTLARVGRAAMTRIRSALRSAWDTVRQRNKGVSPYNLMEESRDGEIESVLERYADRADADLGRPEPAGAIGGTSPPGRPGLVVVDQGNIPEPRQVIRDDTYPAAALDEHQRFAANLAIARFTGRTGVGFMLADGTGVGKTRTILAIADQIQKATGKPALIITQSKQIIAGSFTKDAKAMGLSLKDFEHGTYDDLRTGKIGKGDYSLVMFDESHNLKNLESQKTRAAEQIKADNKLFATATPLDRPTAAAYFLAQIVGRPAEEIHKAVGIVVEEQFNDQTGRMEKRAYTEEGVNWADVMDNLTAIRNQAIEQGAMIRREYPFWGQIGIAPSRMVGVDFDEQRRIDSYWEAKIRSARHPNVKRNYAGQRIGELSRWNESKKLETMKEAIRRELAAGRQVIAVAEGVNPTEIKGLGRRSFPGLLSSLADWLKAEGISFAKIYGTGSKANAVEDFQSGRVQVALATPKSGGTGINLDDVVGNRPRSMLIATMNFSGDVFDQILGRVSRRTTMSESKISFLFFENSMSDVRRQQILDRKIQALRRIQAGEDPDVAIGFEEDEAGPPPGGPPTSRLDAAAQRAQDELRAVEQEIKRRSSRTPSTQFLDPQIVAMLPRYVKAAVKAGTLQWAKFVRDAAQKFGAKAFAVLEPHFRREWARLRSENPGLGMDEPPPAPLGSEQPGRRPPTSIKNAVVDQERAARGLPPMLTTLQMSNEEAFDRAMAMIDADPLVQDRLIKALIENPKSVAQGAETDMLLLHRRVTLSNSLAKAVRAFNAARARGDPAATASAQESVDILNLKLAELEKATKAAGTIAGQTLQARQAMMEEDYSLAGMVAMTAAANGVDTLSAEQTSALQKAHQRIAELEAKKAEIAAESQATQTRKDRQESRAQGQKAISKMVDEVKKERPKRIIAARKEADEAVKEFLSAAGGLFMNPLDPKLIALGVKVAKAYIKLGAASLQDFLSKLAADIGQEKVDKAKETLTAAWRQALQEEKPPQPKRELKNRRQVARFAKVLARYFVESGMVDVSVPPPVAVSNMVIEAVHQELQNYIPEITLDQTWDAYSDYGDFSPLSKDEIDVFLRDMRGQGQQLGKKRDLTAGRAPKRTGKERHPKSDEERRLEKEVNELKRRGGYVVTDPATQLRTTLQGIEKRIDNEISDILWEIENEKRITRERTKTELPPDLQAKRERLLELRKQRDQIFGRPGLTDAQRLKLAEDAVERANKKLVDRLARGDVDPAPRGSKIPKSTRMAALRAEHEALTAQLKYFRELNNPRRTLEEIGDAAYEAGLKRRIADYQKRLAEGDFAPRKPKTTRREDPRFEPLRLELEREKLAYHRGLAQARWKRMSKIEKTFWGSAEALNTSRAILTSMDLSGVLRQGGIAVASHPILASKAMIPMFRSFVSEAGASREAHNLEHHPNAAIHKRSGLVLTKIGGSLKEQEEVFMSHFLDRIQSATSLPGRIVKNLLRPVRASNRAYVAVLNRIRVDLFDSLYATLGKGGALSEAEEKVIANYVNVATGRGNMGRFQAAAKPLAHFYFAPKHQLSRFQYLLAQPLLTKGSTWRTKKLIAREYARTLTGVGLFIASAELALRALKGPPGDGEDDWNIEWNPLSSDFMKIRIGKTRIDPLFGLQQVTVLLSRVGAGATKTFEGEILPLREKWTVSESKTVPYGRDKADATIGRFHRTKLSPLLGAVYNLASGENVVGEEVTAWTTARDFMVPLSLRNVFDLMEEHGVPAGIAIQLLETFGMSVQSYEGPIARMLREAG